MTPTPTPPPTRTRLLVSPDTPPPVAAGCAEPVSSAARVPRVLTFAVVKRIDPRLPNTWGHWWIELDDEQSYGWWPTPCPMRWRGAVLGTRGVLNGIGTPNGGSMTRDAYHGDEPDHAFHPTLVLDKSDDDVRAEIRAFAQRYAGGFRWQWWWLRQPAENCRTFQDEMFAAVGLLEEARYLYSRGAGCPFMYPFRVVKWRTVDALHAGLARVRGWSAATRRRRRRHDDRPATRVRGARRHPPAALGPALTDPKARAQAKIRGSLQRRPPTVRGTPSPSAAHRCAAGTDGDSICRRPGSS